MIRENVINASFKPRLECCDINPRPPSGNSLLLPLGSPSSFFTPRLHSPSALPCVVFKLVHGRLPDPTVRSSEGGDRLFVTLAPSLSPQHRTR